MFIFFFFNDTATTEIYTLSLHDALPISGCVGGHLVRRNPARQLPVGVAVAGGATKGRARNVCQAKLLHTLDRKSTRLNSSHANISYAVFCLKKKKTFFHTLHYSTPPAFI